MAFELCRLFFIEPLIVLYIYARVEQLVGVFQTVDFQKVK